MAERPRSAKEEASMADVEGGGKTEPSTPRSLSPRSCLALGLTLAALGLVVGILVGPPPLGLDLFDLDNAENDTNVVVSSSPSLSFVRSVAAVVDRQNANSRKYRANRSAWREEYLWRYEDPHCSDVAVDLLPHAWRSLDNALEIPDRYSGGSNTLLRTMVLEDSMALPAVAMAAPAPSAAPSVAPSAPTASPSPSSSSSSSQKQRHSETNNQVEGVDEADFVKQDGDRIFAVGGGELVVVSKDPSSRGVVARLDLNSDPKRSFLALDMVIHGEEGAAIVFAASQEPNQKPAVLFQSVRCALGGACVLEWEGQVEGNFVSARMAGGVAYLAVQNRMYEGKGGEGVAPMVRDSSAAGEREANGCDEILRPLRMEPRTLVTLVSVRVGGTGEILDTVTVASPSSWREPTLMMSQNRVFLGLFNAGSASWRGTNSGYFENTLVTAHTFDKDGVFAFDGLAEIPGELLNQFSLDEHDGHLRLATTMDAYDPSGFHRENMVFIIDLETWEVVGSIHSIAPGERIYSARFMGDKAYMVTFREVDPLFVLDLSVPTDPRILGELKIPGYSDYLHPVNQTHLVGLGRGGTEDGRLTGIKAALFDVADPSNPLERYNLELGGRQSKSFALDDHRAFLMFNRPDHEGPLLAFPVVLSAPGGSYKSCGDPWEFSGAVVYELGASGFEPVANVTHDRPDSTYLERYLGKASLCGDCPALAIRRILWSDDELWTLSDAKIKATSMITWKDTWQGNLHARRSLMAEGDCDGLKKNGLVSNLTSARGYDLAEAMAMAIGSGYDQEGKCDCLGEELDRSDAPGAWESYRHCETALGSQTYNRLGAFAGNCCSLDWRGNATDCLAGGCPAGISYSECVVWF